MPTVQIKAHLTAQQLLKAVEQMPQEDLEFFIEQIALLRARQHVSKLSQEETKLMETINQGLAEQDQLQFERFLTKRETRDLTPDENQEYLRLATLAEALNVERMKSLAKLAQLRRTTLRGVMQDLGIQTPVDA